MPEFLDVLRNYDGGALAQDSLVRRLSSAGRRLVFYGDDTWLRLFPGDFLRQDGTHSFFVNDYTEVRPTTQRYRLPVRAGAGVLLTLDRQIACSSACQTNELIIFIFPNLAPLQPSGFNR